MNIFVEQDARRRQLGLFAQRPPIKVAVEAVAVVILGRHERYCIPGTRNIEACDLRTARESADIVGAAEAINSHLVRFADLRTRHGKPLHIAQRIVEAFELGRESLGVLFAAFGHDDEVTGLRFPPFGVRDACRYQRDEKGSGAQSPVE
ncbi:MAG TPA: hypothetical protein PK217_06440 [Sphingopyxis terrae]|nr:hypothetical protein [Sphingopyxis terrae]